MFYFYALFAGIAILVVAMLAIGLVASVISLAIVGLILLFSRKKSSLPHNPDVFPIIPNKEE